MKKTMKKPIIGALTMSVLMSAMLVGCNSNKEQTIYGQITTISGERYTLSTFNMKERGDNSNSRQDPGTPPSTVEGDEGIPPAIGEPPTQSPSDETSSKRPEVLDFTGDEKTITISSNTSINSKRGDAAIKANELQVGDTIEVTMKGGSIISISIMNEKQGGDTGTTATNINASLESFGYETALFI